MSMHFETLPLLYTISSKVAVKQLLAKCRVGVASGIYIFDAPLKRWAEQQKRLLEQQQQVQQQQSLEQQPAARPPQETQA